MKKVLTLICLLICFIACKQDQLLLFESKDSIYFNNMVDKLQDDSLKFTFANSLASVTDSVLYIPIKLLGNMKDYDREISLQILATSTAKEGVHYQKLEKQVLPANAIEGYVKIKLFRSSDLMDTSFMLDLSILSNEHFTTDYQYWEEKVTDTISISTLQFHLSTTDVLLKPKGWTATVEKVFLGAFSRVKLLLLCDLVGITPSKLDQISTVDGRTYNVILKHYLGVKKEEGNTVYDENGNELTVP